MKIVVAQFWTRNLTYSKFTRAINEKYCNEQNYIYHVEDNDDKIIQELDNRSFTWYKPKLIKDVLQKYNPDFVLFLDADAIVCDFSYRIENFIHKGYDCTVTFDYGPSVMNAGVLLFKNSDWTKSFLDKWWHISNELEGPNKQPAGFYHTGLWHDQTCFGHLYKTDETCKRKIKIIDNKVLNGSSYKDPRNKNFIFHAFAYGLVRNRTLDLAYYDIFNIPKPEGKFLLDIVDKYYTDKHYEHDYFNLIYSELFFRNYSKIKKFIEIGTQNGASLELWRDYFNNADVVGVHVDSNTDIEKINLSSSDRITLELLTQSKEDDLVSFAEKYSDVDVILDDGTHKMYDQQITLAKLFRILKPGGIYIIEDLHTSLEAKMPEKRVFNWGDPNRTCTLDMLQEYTKSGKITSDYISKEDQEYLNNSIKSIEIFYSKPNWSITSVIVKK